MNIQLDNNFRITSDKLNFILEEKRIAKSGKNKGKEIWVNAGYFSTLQQVLRDYIQTSIKCSNISTVKGLIQKMDELEEVIKKVNKRE